MKLNNNGFAISTILYGLLALVVLILMLIFVVMRTSNNNSKELGENVNSKLSACREERLNYNYCLADSTCSDKLVLKNELDACLADN